MQISYKKNLVTTVCNIAMPEVAANYIKYLLKNVVDVVEANGHAVTLKGVRVYVNGKASTWGALPLQVGE
jgi:hypothetical protein